MIDRDSGRRYIGSSSWFNFYMITLGLQLPLPTAFVVLPQSTISHLPRPPPSFNSLSIPDVPYIYLFFEHGNS